MECFLLLLAPVGALLVNVVVQLAAHFLRPRTPIVISYLAGFAVGAVGAVVLAWAGGPADWIISLLTFGGLSYGYTNFVNVNYSSLRLRLLKEMVRDGGVVAAEDLRARYGSEAVLDRRLLRLVEWGQLRRDGDAYHAVRGGFFYLAGVFVVLKRLLLGRAFRYESDARP